MVKIRLQRVGKKKAPFYHIVVADSKSPRDGKIIEQIGIYDPMIKPVVIKIDNEKVAKWIKNGAKPSDTVKYLIDKAANPETVEKPKKAEKVEEKVEEVQEEKVEKVEKTVKAEKAEKIVKAEEKVEEVQEEKNEKVEKAPKAKAEKEEKEEKVEKADKKVTKSKKEDA